MQQQQQELTNALSAVQQELHELEQDAGEDVRLGKSGNVNVSASTTQDGSAIRGDLDDDSDHLRVVIAERNAIMMYCQQLERELSEANCDRGLCRLVLHLRRSHMRTLHIALSIWTNHWQHKSRITSLSRSPLNHTTSLPTSLGPNEIRLRCPAIMTKTKLGSSHVEVVNNGRKVAVHVPDGVQPGQEFTVQVSGIWEQQEAEPNGTRLSPRAMRSRTGKMTTSIASLNGFGNEGEISTLMFQKDLPFDLQAV